MRHAPDNVQKLVAPAVESLGYELVGVEFLPQGGHGLLRVYIDSEAGITLADCQRVSHQLSGVLDVEDVIKGRYHLEVSSPGLDRPLFEAKHFERFAGSQVNVKLAAPINGRRKLRGVLQGMKGDDVVLDVDGEVISVPLSAIDKANLVPEI
jgi:ribosome maturation factor RimP